MCIICIEFNRNKDLDDAWRMLEAAGREPSSIPQAHLDKVRESIEKMQKDPSAPSKAELDIEE